MTPRVSRTRQVVTVAAGSFVPYKFLGMDLRRVGRWSCVVHASVSYPVDVRLGDGSL